MIYAYWHFFRMSKDFLYFISSSLGFNFVHQITCSLNMDGCSHVILFSINKSFYYNLFPNNKANQNLFLIIHSYSIWSTIQVFNNLSLSLLWFVVLILFLWRHSSNQNLPSSQYSMATYNHANSFTPLYFVYFMLIACMINITRSILVPVLSFFRVNTLVIFSNAATHSLTQQRLTATNWNTHPHTHTHTVII